MEIDVGLVDADPILVLDGSLHRLDDHVQLFQLIGGRGIGFHRMPNGNLLQGDANLGHPLDAHLVELGDMRSPMGRRVQDALRA